MKTRALICDASQSFTLSEVQLPDPGPQQVLVRTLFSGVSIGTEFALIQGKLNWGPYPLCTGYQGTGTVEAAGSDVQQLAVGDRVYYRGGTGMTLDGQPVSCVAGTHAAHALVNVDDTIQPLPPEADPAISSTFVMPAVGLHGTDLANPRIGETVVVSGVGLIGLGVVHACSQRGCLVVAVDLDADRLAVAAQLGADVLIDAGTQDVAEEVRALSPGGADVVFESTGNPECIKPAIGLCRNYGRFVWQGNYGSAPFPYEFLPAHGSHLTMFHPCNDGEAPCRRAVIKNMAAGTLPWDKTITHRVGADESPALFDMINKGNTEKVLGAIIDWS